MITIHTVRRISTLAFRSNLWGNLLTKSVDVTILILIISMYDLFKTNYFSRFSIQLVYYMYSMGLKVYLILIERVKSTCASHSY